MTRKKPAMRTARPANMGSMLMVTFVVAMILGVVFFKSLEFKEKKASLEKRDNYLIERIEEQNKRSEDIEEYRKYMQTKQYIEDMAKSRLGLVYKDEIIFEADD
ncbi:MAG: septum formation initiator family protein [Lachnospiraceae bacterium]|nr:septum formation initiator family protein [Lachnospiraceae bacterium]